jgi:hypothetical protein
MRKSELGLVWRTSQQSTIGNDALGHVRQSKSSVDPRSQRGLRIPNDSRLAVFKFKSTMRMTTRCEFITVSVPNLLTPMLLEAPD